MLTNLALGLILSSIMGFGGYHRRALTKSGVLGAILVGTAIFSFGGWVWGILLVAFFVSSSALSFFKDSDKSAVAEKFDKSSRRDLAQALANGGLGAVIATLSVLFPAPWWWFAFVGSMATVNADTWATELGILSRQPPRLITSGKVVPPGTSGGITRTGTLATFGGGLFIGLIAWLFLTIQAAFGGGPANEPLWPIILIAGFSGLAGSLFDSLLGATLQVMYVSVQDGQETERKFDRVSPPFEQATVQIQVNQANTRLRGLAWLNNDWVNFISAIVGALVAVGISRFI